jgi:hypothetical protein
MTIGVARAVSNFSLGFDSLAPVTGAILQDAQSEGYKFVGRYLHNLTPSEVNIIFALGFGIWCLTYAPTGVVLNAATGAQHGAQDVSQAKALQIPSLVDITLDFESPAAGSDGPAHINAAAGVLTSAGYGDPLYVGGPEPLNGSQLGSLATKKYAKGGGQIPEPPCGWCIIQLEPLNQPLFGTRVDVDISKQDYLGRSMVLWWGK